MSVSKPGTSGSTQLELELYFLISKFLEDGPLKDTAKVLKQELKEFQLLPKRVDWRGCEHFRSYENLLQTYRHVSPTHLLKICQRICPLVDQEIPPHVKGVLSLLGAGSQSILRTKEERKHTIWSLSTHTAMKHRVPLLSPPNMLSPNIVKVALARELCGVASARHLRSGNIYTKVSQLSKALGHLSAVYCILFDRTGDFIITGADDHLVKIWSSMTGRLFATLRGHSAEITDMAVSYDNRLLACGSCDKAVRVWSLKTTSPVAVLHAHTGMITSIEFCPSTKGDIRYLASTGSDGCVCFWAWNPKTMQFNPKPTKFIEKSRAGAQMLCSSFSPGGIFLATGNSDHVVRVYSYNYGNFEKIAELDAHTDAVDSIQYSNRCTRFVSGSKDGTARIWRYERQNWVAVVLKMSSKIDSIYSDDLPTPNKLRVSMVSWSLDDQYAITAVIDCTIKVWNSHTGTLLHTLKGHNDEIFVLENNPIDSRILLSAGHDGLIIIWDIVSGTLIKTFSNEIQGQGHGAVFDCKWSPTGLGFAATDSHGFLRYFSFGSNDAYKRNPNEVFFHTDYRPLMRDSNNYVLDEQTQQPPHLMPPAFLVDMDGSAHIIRHQRLVPGREKYLDKYQVPQIGTTPSGDREVLDHSAAELALDEPNTPDLSITDRDIVDHMIERMQREQDERIVAAGGNPNLLSPEAQQNMTSPLRAVPSTSSVTSQQQTDKGGVKKISIWMERTCVKPLNKCHVKREEKLRTAYMDVEIKSFTVERKKKPVLPSEDSSDSLDHVKTRHHKSTRVRATRSGESTTVEETAANRLTTRALYDTDIEDEGEDDIGSDEGWCSNSSDSSTEYSDWAADGAAVLQPPKRRSTRQVKRRRYTSSGGEQPEDDEETEIDENVEEESDNESQHSGPSQRSVKPRRRGRKPGPMRKRRESRKQRQKREVMENQFDVTELVDDFKPPEWLSDPIPRKTPYFPQMGDEVIYLRQGHELYVKAVSESKVYKIHAVKGHPWHKRPNIREQELVKVVGIKYEFKPGSKGVRLVCLKLASIDPDTSQLNGWTFTIKYHDMPDVVDFLVLRQTYDNAVRNKWKVGWRFRSMIDGAWWFGKIHSHTPYQDTFPDSLFLCYFVNWDNGEEEKMSPWDFEPIDETNLPPVKGGSVPLTANEIKSLMYQPAETEWPEYGRDAECERVISGLEQIMELSVAEPFLAPVDLNAFPLYAMIVEYPIDLSLIKARLENRFYRRITSVQYDVRYIEINTTTFNQSDSEIVQQAKLVTELCLRLVSDCECTDIMPVYNLLAKDTEFTLASKESDTESDKSGPSRRVSRRRISVRRPSRRNSSLNPEAWREDVLELIDTLINQDDGVPFRSPVNPILYLDYFDRIDHPMDLGTIRDHLHDCAYDNPLDFCKDVRLVFSNSKTYNTNRRSRIYTMTINLSNFFEEHIKKIVKQWRNAQAQTKKKTKRTVSSKVYKLKLNAQRSLKDSPSKSHANRNSATIPARSRSSASRSRAKEEVVLGNEVGTFTFVVKRQRIFSESAAESDEETSHIKQESSLNKSAEDDETEIDSDYDVGGAKSIAPVRHKQSQTKSKLVNGNSRYTTRTKTGSVKRKHYDHLSETENESPNKQRSKVPRRIKSEARSETETEDEQKDLNVSEKSGRWTNKQNIRLKAENSVVKQEYGSETESPDNNSDPNSASNTENDSDYCDQTARKSANFKGASRPKDKGKSRRVENGRGQSWVSNSANNPGRRRGVSDPQSYDVDNDIDDDDDEIYSHRRSKGRRSTRNQGKQTVRYDEYSDDEYLGSSPMVNVSSRGRVRKARGFFDES